MVQSMTGFAAVTAEADGLSWSIEIRGVNAKGLDVRLRLPEKMLQVEAAFKSIFTKKFERGNINVSVRVDTSQVEQAISLDEDVIDAYLNAAIRIRSKAKNMGLKLAQSSAADILALRGSLKTGDDKQVEIPFERILASVVEAADAFEQMRIDEGRALSAILTAQIDQVEELVAQSTILAEARKEQVADNLRSNVKKIMANSEGVEEGRIAQELALLAVKADVTEEIDRLGAHVTAARTLLQQQGSIGRKFDFLMQEFNREANTLCSKSGSTELTRVGLDLKALIDQMREQVQNVE